MECPNCGAALKFNEELKNCMCNYCGHEFFIYDGSNRDKGKNQTYKRGERTILLPRGVSQEYINAVKAAYSYNDTCHMSKIELYDMLSTEDGEGFPSDAAQFGIDHADIDYKETALEKARSYFYGDICHMSKKEVYDMLTGEGGHGFTAEEAQYAIDHLEDEEG